MKPQVSVNILIDYLNRNMFFRLLLTLTHTPRHAYADKQLVAVR